MQTRFVLFAILLCTAATAQASDLAVTAILAPRDTVIAGDSITSRVRIKNVGSADVSGFLVNIYFRSSRDPDATCYGWRDFLSLRKGDSMEVTTSQCVLGARGWWSVNAEVVCTSDSNPHNDTVVSRVFVIGNRNGVFDLSIGTVVLPHDTMLFMCPFNPSVWVRNQSDSMGDGFFAACEVLDSTGRNVFFDANVGKPTKAHDSSLVTFSQFTPFTWGLFQVVFYVANPNDTIASNDTLRKFFDVEEQFTLYGATPIQFTEVGAAADAYSSFGFLAFYPIASSLKPPWGFINILVRKNDTSPSYWVVRNYRAAMLSAYSNGSRGMFIDFRRMGLKPGERVRYLHVIGVLSDTPLVQAPAWNSPCPGDAIVEWLPFAAAPDTLEDPSARHVNTRFVDAMPSFGTYGGLSDTVHRDTLVLNVDLDSTRTRYTSPAYQRDWGADGTAAVANAVGWLEACNPAALHTALTEHARLEELSLLSARTRNAPMSFRDMVRSTLAYIDSQRIPLRVRFATYWNDVSDVASPDPRYEHKAKYEGAMGLQLAARRSPQWNWLVQALADSEAVVMYLGWWDSTGVRRGGHAVTVTGTASFSGTHQVRFVDDLRQDTAGVTVSPSAYWDVSPEGYARLLDVSWPNRMCFVEGLIATRLDTSVTFIPTDVREPLQAHGVAIELSPSPARTDERIAVDAFVAHEGTYRVSVVDVTGREIAILHAGALSSGAHRFEWRADHSPQGVYFVTVTGEGKRSAARVVRF